MCVRSFAFYCSARLRSYIYNQFGSVVVEVVNVDAVEPIGTRHDPRPLMARRTPSSPPYECLGVYACAACNAC